MNPISEKSGKRKKDLPSLYLLFVPTLLCLAMFPTSFALAEMNGGYNNIPESGDYGNRVSLTNNDVRITNETISGDVYGAYTENNPAVASGNRVTIINSNIGEDIFGGSADASTVGKRGKNILAGANNNNVTVSGNSIVTRNIYGGYANAKAETNANANAYATADASFSADIYVRTNIYGSENTSATANNNSVTVSGNSIITGNIYGGYVKAETNTDVYTYAPKNANANANANVYSSENITVIATDNTITIDSSTVTEGNTIAGGAVYINSPDDTNGTHIATNNTVTLTGNYSINNVSLYGGFNNGNSFISVGPNDDLFSGNTLNLDARKVPSTSVDQVAHFETINIRAGNVGNGDTVLETRNTVLGVNGDDSKGTTVNLISVENASLKTGDTLTLISHTDGSLANDGEHQFVFRGDRFAVGYEAEISQQSNHVVALFTGERLNPETKVLNESRAASLALINSGTDLLLDADIRQRRGGFGAVRGGHSRYDSGSSVDVDGVNLIAGFAHTLTGANGDLSGGAFIEAGWGDTATHNTIGGKRLHGNGNAHYYGAGVLGRYDWTWGALKGLYADASLRAGRLSNDYHNDDAVNANGQRVSYDADSTYYAAHFGMGFQWNLTEVIRMDSHARYLYAHVDSENTSILNDRYHFDSMDSHRTRVGVRLDYTADPQYTPYMGVAWEYEFDGKAKGRVLGYSMDDADLGGSSGIVSLGVDFRPSKNLPLTVNAGIAGYVGEHEGVAGQFRMHYAF